MKNVSILVVVLAIVWSACSGLFGALSRQTESQRLLKVCAGTTRIAAARRGRRRGPSVRRLLEPPLAGDTIQRCRASPTGNSASQ